MTEQSRREDGTAALQVLGGFSCLSCQVWGGQESVKGLVVMGSDLLHGVEERWIMRGWQREGEHSAIGAEKGGCRGGGEGGRNDVV